ncbi:hypothetical protein AQUSIP_02560 [Aquicella siphonis]|uniref:Uncharacterized protein n=1 Tax=Aquicella siphonis TaxID=254247 RepID=A0A5E4PEH8_9COXI|nr:hypothetical protein AQUSIP_02560 [Aquicella siphonis]
MLFLKIISSQVDYKILLNTLKINAFKNNWGRNIAKTNMSCQQEGKGFYITSS